MILYTNKCPSCGKYKRQYHALQQYAATHHIKLEERRITRSPEWREEAEQYEISLPFIVNGKQAIHLSEPLERLEE